MIRTAERTFYPALNGVRILAFLLVFVHHAHPSTGTFLDTVGLYGWVGVDVFFVISSFLIFSLFIDEQKATERINVPMFYIRRMLRLYPLMVAFPLAMYLYHTPHGSLLRLIGIAAFADNILCWFEGINNIKYSFHLWSLSAEFQIYFVAPFIFILVNRIGITATTIYLCVFYVLSLCARIIAFKAHLPHPDIYVTPLFRPESIICGALLAYGAFKGVSAWMLLAALLCSIAAVVWNSMPWEKMSPAILTYPAVAIAAVSLVQLSLTQQWLIKTLSWRPISYLGEISFGLYIFHLYGLRVGRQIAEKANLQQYDIVVMAIALIATIAISSASYFAFERQIDRIRHRFSWKVSRQVPIQP